jgi:hypothetical protein
MAAVASAIEGAKAAYHPESTDAHENQYVTASVTLVFQL